MLTDDASLKIQAARGHVLLADYESAERELDEVGLESDDPDYAFVLGERCRLCLTSGDYKRSDKLARELGRAEPDSPQWMILLAEAQRIIRGEADAILANCEFMWPENSVVPFNRACCCCALGRLEEAKGHLLRAIALDESNRERAWEHGDLEPLREWLASD